MPLQYDEAVSQLYQAPLAEFVVLRKRLATELKASGDKASGKQLESRGRPSVSAWAVNQLYFRHRQEFERLLDAAQRARSGEREALARHRETLTKLRAHAAELLRGAGNAASEATLQRVTITLSALAAAGSFDPDPPGALVSDRDPPGFEALGGFAAEPSPKAAPAERAEEDEPRTKSKSHSQTEAAETHAKAKAKAKAEADAQAETRAAKLRAEAEAKALAEAQQRRRELRAQRERLEHKRREAETEFAASERELSRIQKELKHAEASRERAQRALDQARLELQELANEE